MCKKHLATYAPRIGFLKQDEEVRISGPTPVLHDYLPEVVVPDLDHYRIFLLSKLLELSLVREVRSNIAIQTLKAGAILPLDHLRASAA